MVPPPSVMPRPVLSKTVTERNGLLAGRGPLDVATFRSSRRATTGLIADRKVNL